MSVKKKHIDEEINRGSRQCSKESAAVQCKDAKGGVSQSVLQFMGKIWGKICSSVYWSLFWWPFLWHLHLEAGVVLREKHNGTTQFWISSTKTTFLISVMWRNSCWRSDPQNTGKWHWGHSRCWRLYLWVPVLTTPASTTQSGSLSKRPCVGRNEGKKVQIGNAAPLPSASTCFWIQTLQVNVSTQRWKWAERSPSQK